MKKKKEKSIFQQEMERDIGTFKRLHGKKRLQFVMDYYKWYILAAIVIILIIASFAHMFYEGQKDYRLRICAVLNTDRFCSSWFDDFEKELQKDGNETPIQLNEEQPFDYDDMYYYVEELEIQVSVSYNRMDVAICGPDMYSYLLKMNACYPLDELLPEEDFKEMEQEGMLDYNTANLRENEDGSIDDSNAEEGYFAVDISDTSFGKEYNKDSNDPLYAIIIVNTEHTEDSVRLIQALCE